MTRPLLTHDEVKAQRDARKAVKDAMRTPLKKVNRERQAKKAESEGFDPDYLEWIRKQPCIICGLVTGQPLHESERSERGIGVAFIEASHMRAGRTKGTDMTALPVERFFHRTGPQSQHKIGIRSWAEHFGLDIPALIAAHRKRYSLEMAEKAKSSSQVG